ncbi:ornithine monooxygenase [Pokkaliibacter plantistimulans]|uniref:Ornithine monooxygenase n=1 Tax=Pokkaliibacter plantistimulans TaxID=1635171 RepID=A0ABX5LSN5_9GAMM|nr:lysine N(6)-hydroxylase/L-ornithine N(5)-oxygenase family protein [Pokkaliibacter plantistimulans]PXF29174.1 ornithine monooxygenase [Pokkaliibacter plantistimulans]
MHIHDLIGVGFGPSNLSLAIALAELPQAAGTTLDSCFIERQNDFVWHGNMLLDGTTMQVSFLKDLATLRNPASAFTFINYLHQNQRLEDFINLKTFFPSRQEFNQYLTWAADHFDQDVHYGEEVVEVLPQQEGREVVCLRVRSRGSDGRLHERLTRNLALGIGGSPRIPEEFRGLAGHPQVFHSSRYLQQVAALPSRPLRIAVVGAGQSAAEIFMDLHSRHPGYQVDLISRSRALKPADDSPFVNEVFNPSYTDFIYASAEEDRSQLLTEFSNTNYAVVDLPLIEQIYQTLYLQKVSSQQRHRYLRCHGIAQAEAHGDQLALTLHDQDSGTFFRQDYDAVILATGFQRQAHHQLLAPLADWLDSNQTDRYYRVATRPHFLPQIFLQGCSENTHGLSDTLLSVLAIRSAEIRDALLPELQRPSRKAYA